VKTLKIALLALSAAFTTVTAFAATATVTRGQWELFRSGSTTRLSTHASETDCVNAAKALNITRTYNCKTSSTVAVTSGTTTCPSRPSDESRTVSCPSGTTGSWSQSRTYTSAAYPTCWTPSEWSPDSAPDGYCTSSSGGSGSGQVITVQNGGSISSAVSQLQPGGTVVIKPGSYSAFNLKACSSTSWCTIKAETDGTVQVSGMNFGAGNWYTRIEGLKFSGNNTKTITGSYIKFFRTAFAGGPTSGNAVTLQIGTNDRTPGASNILLEDSWVYGTGGRYKVLVYNAAKIVLRRVVTRHDGGWSYDGDNPQGGFALYDSVDVACQDCMFLDPVSNLSGFEAAMYLVSNGTTSQRQSNIIVNGGVIINSPNNGLAAEGTGTATTYNVKDVAVVNSAAGGFNTNNSSHVLNITRGLASVRGAPYAAWRGSVNASACVYKGGSNQASLSNCSGTLPKYPTVLNASGQGANIQNRIGVSGTLFGEAGYNDTTSQALWPYPNEARIKTDFDGVRAAFGGKTVTKYVLEQFGNAAP
jgi:hypothetical protein